MRMILVATLVAVGIAAIAAYVLDDNFQTNSYSAFTTEGARISGPGDNLVTF